LSHASPCPQCLRVQCKIRPGTLLRVLSPVDNALRSHSFFHRVRYHSLLEFSSLISKRRMILKRPPPSPPTYLYPDISCDFSLQRFSLKRRPLRVLLSAATIPFLCKLSFGGTGLFPRNVLKSAPGVPRPVCTPFPGPPSVSTRIYEKAVGNEISVNISFP